MPTPDRCPCLSGETYTACCAPLHQGAQAPTAERLMRSRFTAFARNDATYLRASWHPSTRPPALELDDDLRWYRLDIDSRTAGGPLDTTGTVEFTAYYRSPSGPGQQHETSRFEKHEGRWFYVDAV